MEIINYSLSVIVVFLGLIIGIILARIAPEELSSGKKYFTLLQKIFFFFIFLILLYSFKLNWIINLILSLIFIIFLIFIKLKKNIITYNLLAIILFLSSFNQYFTYISTLIFLYGLPTGSLFYYNAKKNKIRRFFKYYIWFLIIAILPFLLINL